MDPRRPMWPKSSSCGQPGATSHSLQDMDAPGPRGTRELGEYDPCPFLRIRVLMYELGAILRTSNEAANERPLGLYVLPNSLRVLRKVSRSKRPVSTPARSKNHRQLVSSAKF